MDIIFQEFYKFDLQIYIFDYCSLKRTSLILKVVELMNIPSWFVNKVLATSNPRQRDHFEPQTTWSFRTPDSVIISNPRQRNHSLFHPYFISSSTPFFSIAQTFYEWIEMSKGNLSKNDGAIDDKMTWKLTNPPQELDWMRKCFCSDRFVVICIRHCQFPVLPITQT